MCVRINTARRLSHTHLCERARANSSHVGGERRGNMSGGARASKQQMQPRTLAPNNQIIKTHPNTLKNPSVTSARRCPPPHPPPTPTPAICLMAKTNCSFLLVLIIRRVWRRRSSAPSAGATSAANERKYIASVGSIGLRLRPGVRWSAHSRNEKREVFCK